MKKPPDAFFSAPLAGLTVPALTRVLSGPYCTMLAADMGARVIKIEHLTRGDDTRAWGPVYLDIGMYHPPLYRFLEMRQEMGVRNLFHPIARLLNPSRAAAQVVGLSHRPHFEKTAEVLRMLGCPRALVIRGVEGDPELSVTAATRLLELRDERITPLGISPKDFGLALGTSRDMAGVPPGQQDKEAELLRRIIHNQIPGGPKDWVLMNAALLLYAAGKGATLPACLPIARAALEGGAAGRKLDELRRREARGVERATEMNEQVDARFGRRAQSPTTPSRRG